MKKIEIYTIFKAGVLYGLKDRYNVDYDPDKSLWDLFKELTITYPIETQRVLFVVLTAGDNIGVNLFNRRTTEAEFQKMFENLIQGKPLENGDHQYWNIKEKIDKIITE